MEGMEKGVLDNLYISETIEAQREPSLDQVRSSCQSELEFVCENLKLRMRGKGGKEEWVRRA